MVSNIRTQGTIPFSHNDVWITIKPQEIPTKPLPAFPGGTNIGKESDSPAMTARNVRGDKASALLK